MKLYVACRFRRIVARELRVAGVVCAVAGAGITGCARTVILRVQQHFVRLDALVRLEPRFRQLAIVQATGSAVNRHQWSTSTPVPLAAINWVAFTPAVAEPVPLAKGAGAATADEDLRYLAQVQRYLARKDQTRLDREQRSGLKLVDAQVAVASAADESNLRARAFARAQQIDRQLQALGFRSGALRAQMRVFTDQAYRDARLQHSLLQQDILRLQQQRDAVTQVNVPAQVARDMAPPRKKQVADLSARIDAEAATLARARMQRLDRIRSRLPGYGKSPGTLALPPIRAFAVRQPVSRLGSAQSFLAPIALAQQLAADSQRASVLADDQRRTRVVANLRADVWQAAMQIAARQGWKLVPQGTPYATDATARVAAALISQWRSRLQP